MHMAEAILDIARLRARLSYDTETGEFRWRTTGKLAGSPDEDGYLRIGIDGRRYRAHRLAWFYVHGEWPDLWIDHIDGVPSNNAIANLRQVTNAENQQNRAMQRNNKSGYRGVSQTAAGKWAATIRRGAAHTYLGIFDCPKEASTAYEAARRDLFEFQPVARDFPLLPTKPLYPLSHTLKG
jgi:hypothetical protein